MDIEARMGLATERETKRRTDMKIQTIEINGAEVELHWGEGVGLGTAIHTIATDDVGVTGPSDGDTFTLDGKVYELGQHEYSTDQPGCEDDTDCTCTAAIYAGDNNV